MKRETEIEGRYQMTIGEIIEKIKSMGLVHGDESKPKSVQFDFGTAVPTNVNSWRGSYDCPSIGYKLTGYDNDAEHLLEISAENFIKELELGISGKEYTGWKGGEYTYNSADGLWVSKSNTVIIDVVDKGWYYLLVTAYCEY